MVVCGVSRLGATCKGTYLIVGAHSRCSAGHCDKLQWSLAGRNQWCAVCTGSGVLACL